MAVLVLPDHTAEPLLLLQELKQEAVGRYGLCSRDVTCVKCFCRKSEANSPLGRFRTGKWDNIKNIPYLLNVQYSI